MASGWDARPSDLWWVVDEMAAVPAVRRATVALAEEIGLSDTRVGEVGIVVSELATNLVRHAGGGEIVIRVVGDAPAQGLRILAIDSGPGSRNIESLISDGSSTGRTLGIGLGACKRLSNAFDIYSVPAVGTIVEAELRPIAGMDIDEGDGRVAADLTRALSSESACGDAAAFRPTPRGWLAMIADGLGHGPLAAEASQRAVDVIEAGDVDDPLDLMARMNAAVMGTRGAAISIVLLDCDAGTVRHVGVGNVVTRLLGAGTDRSLPSQPGIVGHRMPRMREMAYPVQEFAAILMHSDGLTQRWALPSMPDVLRHRPAVGCAALMRAAATRRDDASVLLLRTQA